MFQICHPDKRGLDVKLVVLMVEMPVKRYAEDRDIVSFTKLRKTIDNCQCSRAGVLSAFPRISIFSLAMGATYLF